MFSSVWRVYLKQDDYSSKCGNFSLEESSYIQNNNEDEGEEEPNQGIAVEDDIIKYYFENFDWKVLRRVCLVARKCLSYSKLHGRSISRVTTVVDEFYTQTKRVCCPATTFKAQRSVDCLFSLNDRNITRIQHFSRIRETVGSLFGIYFHANTLQIFVFHLHLDFDSVTAIYSQASLKMVKANDNILDLFFQSMVVNNEIEKGRLTAQPLTVLPVYHSLNQTTTNLVMSFSYNWGFFINHQATHLLDAPYDKPEELHNIVSEIFSIIDMKDSLHRMLNQNVVTDF